MGISRLNVLSGAPLAHGAAPRRWTAQRREAVWGYVLISPWIIGFLAFTLGPMLASLGLSFFETDMLTARFVGVRNFATLFNPDTTRSLFWVALYNTAY